MAGRVVSATDLDSVRIEAPGGRTLTIPARCVLAADRVFRHCLAQDEDLDLDQVEDDATGWCGWEAAAGNLVAHGDTPWGALVALGDAVQDGK